MARIARNRRQLAARVADLEQAVATLIEVVADVEKRYRPAPVAAATPRPGPVKKAAPKPAEK